MTDAKQYAKELHRIAPKKFERRKVYTYFKNDIWACDLMDVSNSKEDNDNITFLLNIVDLYSRYAWSFPLTSKSSVSIVNVFKTMKTFPKNIWVDQGSEFLNKEFKAFCEKHNINLYFTYSGLKSVFVERFNRTLREKMYQYFTEHHTNYYIDILPKLIEDYNNTIHSSIKSKPIDIYIHNKEREKDIQVVNQATPKYKVGDYVRISKVKNTFEKGYTPRWSKEVFKIITVNQHHNPLTYFIEDKLGEKITGSFYEKELQKTELKDFAVIDKILETKKVRGKTQYFVHYDGYGKEFDEWINEKQMTALSKK